MGTVQNPFGSSEKEELYFACSIARPHYQISIIPVSQEDSQRKTKEVLEILKEEKRNT